MSHIFVHDERVVDARPEEVFATLADYKNKRPRILTPNFLNYTVEKGGRGSGTVISYQLHAGGRERPYHMAVEESVKGQVLTERDTNSSLVTRWLVLPVNGGQKSKVSVESDWEGAQGIRGGFERIFAPMGLHGVYKNLLTGLTRTVQTPEKTQRIMKANKRLNIGALLAAIGSAMALAAGINYLRTHPR